MNPIPQPPISKYSTAEQMELLHRFATESEPYPEIYNQLNQIILQIGAAVDCGELDRQSIKTWWKQVSDKHLAGTVQHFVTTTPHGYYGDFEIIDKIYQQEEHTEPRLAAWDRYFHAQAAPAAVRNRKQYLQNLLTAQLDAKQGPVRVLNIGSGPGRDMQEWLKSHPASTVTFDCVEQDPNAIAWARKVCAAHEGSVNFHCANAFTFPMPTVTYDIVWSAGLFDYLNDRLFVRLLRRLLRCASPGGAVVIGNFCPANPSRAYMEVLGGWVLLHRDHRHLRQLAIKSRANPDTISIGSEPSSVNLFLHIKIPSLV